MIIARTIFVFCAIYSPMAVPLDGSLPNDSIEAITRASKDPTLSFVRAGRIAQVMVNKGDVVQVGQVLVQQDDAAEQVQLEQLQAEAEDTTRIKAAQADLDQKKVDLKKFEDAKKKGVATDLEVEHARLDVTIAELSLKLAQFNHGQDKRKYTEAKIQVERMKLISPIAGKVEKLLVQQGESVEGLEDVVQVVTIDPLWIDVPMPLDKTKGIKSGQIAGIEFSGSSGAVRNGKIIHIAAVADAASGTLTIRVEVPNPDDPKSRPAGEHVRVRFTSLVETASLQKGNIRVTNISQKSENKE